VNTQNKKLASKSLRIVALVVLAGSLATLFGCSSGYNSQTAISPMRSSRFGAFPIDEEVETARTPHQRTVGSHGYGYVGG
jgi:hypothetical protein